jgi:hypothetical protein
MSHAINDDDISAELEAMRHAAYPDPADIDRGEVLMATGVGIGLLGVGLVAASAICPPCMMGAVPLAAATAPALLGAGVFKRWRRARHDRVTRETPPQSPESSSDL